MSPARALLLLAAVVFAQGCSSWHAVPLRPEAAPSVDSKHPVRATRMDQSTVVLWHPQVVGDSILGDVGNPPLRTAIALRDLQRLEVLGDRAPLTAGGVARGIGMGALLGVLGVLVLLLSTLSP